VATSFPVGADTRPAIASIDLLIAALIKTGKTAGLTDAQIKSMTEDVKKFGKEGSSQVSGINKNLDNFVNGTLKKAGGALVAFFAVDRLISFQKEIIAISSEFQKFEAVLTNTLGSRSRALLALKQIQEFAAKTPFSVKELTESFVKLANQGFVPTEQEMRKLGDLAASTGKTFDMLTEAIIDAQTGEFERLKEFGIRASKQGDQVKFTFKGVETQTKFTAAAIREYVLGLGDAIGVSGSMAAISETLGGKISNLGDSWDTLLKTLGEQESGPLKNAINNLTLLLVAANEAVKTTEQLQADLEQTAASKSISTLKIMAQTYGDLSVASADYLKLLNGQLAVEKRYNDSLDRTADGTEKAIEESYSRIHVLKAQVLAVQEYTADQIKASATETKTRLGLIETIEKEIKALEVLKSKSSNFDDIAQLNDQLSLLHFRLNILKNAGDSLASTFDKGVFKEWFKSIDADLKKATDAVPKHAEGIMKSFTDKMDKAHREQLAKEKEHQKNMNAARQAGIDGAVTILSQFAAFEADLHRADFDALSAQRDYELQSAGDNAKAKERINKEYDRKERQLKREQAARDRDQALFNIFINTAAAVVKALPNVVLSYIVGGIGLAELLLVAAKPLPKFKDGVYDLEGPGTSTSDSILSRLSKGESVVPENRHDKFGFLIKEIIENPNLNLYDVRSMIDQKLPTQYEKIVMRANTGADSPEMLEELRKTRKAIENMPGTEVNIDEDGFHVWTKRGNYNTEFVNKRYKRNR
jgi:hypothetical protein